MELTFAWKVAALIVVTIAVVVTAVVLGRVDHAIGESVDERRAASDEERIKKIRR